MNLIKTTSLLALALAAALPSQAYVLWGNEHEARAKALAKAYGESSAAVPADRKAISSSDTTLSVWGHGDQTTFSEMTDAQFAELVKNWRKANSKLTTVEIITCDARHGQDDKIDAFAKRAAALIHATYSGVKVKALPIGQHADDYSILWANTGTETFCYITATSKANFDTANAKIPVMEQTTVPKYDLSQVGDAMGRDPARGSKYTVNYGAIRILRSYLGEVK